MSSISHFFGGIFSPIYHFFGTILAAIYGVVPNYGIAIALLTIIIMGALTPFTVKSTRSMKAMQKLQPEIKKLQQKYKGPENRQIMNEELMKLYREEGVNPLGGCLPMFLQMPFLIILYGVIKGLSFTVMKHGHIVSTPRYIPHTSKMYLNLVATGGKINVWGMDLNLRPFPLSSHSSFFAALPFFIFVALAVAMQYFQMAMLNARNAKTGQVIPSQQQTMQRILPIIFAFFYIAIPAAVVLYMIISTGIRIITQYILNRVDEEKGGKRDPLKVLGSESGPRAIPGVASDDEQPALETPKPKASTNKPSSSSNSPRSKSQPRPAPKPQSQARSKAKRKRKAR